MLRRFYSNTSGIVLIILSVTIVGIVQFLDLPIALYPNTSKPQVRVGLSTGTMSGAEFKDRFANDLESALAAIDNTEKVRASYTNGSANFWIEFNWGVESQKAKMDVQSVFESWRGRFPRDFSTPWYHFEGAGSDRVLASLKSTKFSPEELELIIEKNLVPQLQKIRGIASGGVWRLYKKRVLITVNPSKLIQYGVSYEQVLRKLEEHEFDRSLGSLDLQAGGQYQVQADMKSSSYERLKDTIVGYAGPTPIKLSQVAAVEVGIGELTRVSRGNGERKVLLYGSPKPETNLKMFADSFMQELKKFAFTLDPTAEVDVLVNPSDFINDAVDNVIVAVLMGMLVATIVVFLFLGSFRQTIVVGITIPLSLICGFILMKAFGIGVNLISLGGMALAVGMVIDGSIVMLENIARHFENKKPQTYRERLDVIVESAREVQRPTVAFMITTMIVFLPLPFTSPLASAILGDLAIVMVCVLGVSIFVTLFLLPSIVLMLGVRPREFPKKQHVYRISLLFCQGFARITSYYVRSVLKFLRNRRARYSVGILAVVLFFGSLWVVGSILNREVMGTPDTDKLYLWIQLKESYPIPVAEEIAGEFEAQILDKFKEYVKFTYSEVSESSTFLLSILHDKRDVKLLKKKFEDYFKSTPEARVYVGTWTPTSLRIPNPPIIEANILGSTEVDRRLMLEKIDEALSKLADVGRRETQPSLQKEDYLTITPDERKINLMLTSDHMLKDHPLTLGRLLTHVGGFLHEREIMKIVHENDEIYVKIRMPKELLRSPSDMGNLLLRAGNYVLPLKVVAQIQHKNDYSEFVREGLKDISRLKVWPKESYTGSREDLRAQIMKVFQDNKDIDMDRMVFVDTDIEIDENIYSLVYALLLALMLICIVVTLQFGSFFRSLIIMITIPLGFIGASLALWMFSSPLNVNSMLGLILLCGTAINNSIIFLDFYLRLRKTSPKMDVEDVLLETARLRFRPIMVTTLTTIIGMMPIAVGFGSGGEILQPLGIAICGGLGVSTLLTVVLLPVVIAVYEQWRSKDRLLYEAH